jgi:hypothetical protein
VNSTDRLTPAEIRLAQYGERTSTWSTATHNDGTEKALHEIALGLKEEIDRLRAELARETDRINAITGLLDQQELAARGFEVPLPEWVSVVRRTVEYGTAVRPSA